MKTAFTFLLPSCALLLASCGRMTLPQSAAPKWLERMNGRIAYVGLDGNVRTMDQGGRRQKDVTTDAAVQDSASGPSFYYQFPAWSPDAKHLAFVSVRRTRDAVLSAGVWTSAADGAPPLRLYTSDGRVPRYLSWSPDSSRLVFTTGPGTDLQQLDTVSARGGTVRVLDSGTGFAWRWESRGPRLAVHSVNALQEVTAERVAILDSQGVSEDRQLAQAPGDFQAPAWSPDSRGIIMAVSDSAGSTLYVEDSGGAPGKPLAHVDGSATLDLSPDGHRLAWSARPSGGDDGSRSLYVLDLAGRSIGGTDPARASPRLLSGDDYVAAFSWSPDGSKIAYFVPSATDMSLTLKVLNVKTASVRTVSTFTPSPYFLGLLNEFGQYAESVRLWSPNGRFLLYCALQYDSFDVMVAYADLPIEPRKIADGLMATWSPR